MAIVRLNNFSPGTVIRSAEVNAEFDQIIELLSGQDLSNLISIGGPVSVDVGSTKLNVIGPVTIVGDTVTPNPIPFRIYVPGESTPRIVVYANGAIYGRASQLNVTPSTQGMLYTGCIKSANQDVGNVGAGEDPLYIFDIGAHVLTEVGSYISIRANGNLANNANNKRIKFYIKTTAVMDSGIINAADVPWFIDMQIYGDAANARWRCVGRFVCDTVEVRFNQNVTGVNHALANNVKWTGEGVATNDIVQTNVCVEKGMGID